MKDRIKSIKAKIKAAAIRAGRSESDIKLIAITKTHPASLVESALQNGIEFIGENKVQEAEEKLSHLKGKYQEFHFVGHLQSNKIKKLIPLKPVLIHSIDKLSTARKLANYIRKNQLEKQDILIEVNTSAEESKFGVKPDKAIELIKSISELEHIRVQGLMTIGKFTSDEKVIRNCFRILKDLFDNLQRSDFPNIEMKYLSMGMSNDFEIAIEEGSNLVRVGTAIFGSRT